MKRFSTLIEVIGYGAVATAAWLFDMRLGILVAGIALVVIAYGMERGK